MPAPLPPLLLPDDNVLALIEHDPFLHGIGDKLITHRFPIDQITQAFSLASSPACIKAVIEHGSDA